MKTNPYQTIKDQLLPITRKIDALARETPCMTEKDYASEHGWISAREHADALKMAKKMTAAQDRLVLEIRKIQEASPDQFADFMQTLLTELDELRSQLKEQASSGDASEQVRAKAHHLEIRLADIGICLADWSVRQKSSHWPAWSWRFVFEDLAASQALLAGDPLPTAGRIFDDNENH